MNMIGENYDRALALADDDPELLEEVHSLITQYGISEETYAKVFARLAFTNKETEERISYSTIEKAWKKGTRPVSDVKLLASFSQACDLIRYYTLASWDNCVFSAWCSKREVVKAEKEMDEMENYTHAKNIINESAPLMEDNTCESKIDWAENDESGPIPFASEKL